jgi:menaquinone-dependent protoporphyrinogen oxidase
MKPILILYATREGQTRRIAEHIAKALATNGLPAQLIDAAAAPEPFEIGAYGAAVLAASIHAGKHEREMVAFVKRHRDALAQLPTVFLSTTMTAADLQNPERSQAERDHAHAEVERLIQEFFQATGFRATVHKPIAGALLYTQYNWLVRVIMKHISKAHGGPTDTSRDYEYTDWVELDRFVEGLVASGFGTRGTAGAAQG